MKFIITEPRKAGADQVISVNAREEPPPKRAYLVDCNVKGFDAGTPDVPCFPLKTLWEHSLIPAIKALTAANGPCAGAQVVFQEDNAGPHTEKRYASWMNDTFGDLGWKIELQAPQG